MRKALLVLILLSRLCVEHCLALLYFLSSGYLLLAIAWPHFFTYRPLKWTALAVFMGVNAVFALSAIVADVTGALAWLRDETPRLLLRVVRSTWQRREFALETTYYWSRILPLKNNLFWLKHPRFKNILVSAYGSAIACFYLGGVYMAATNRYTFRAVILACGQIGIAGVLVFLFFKAVDLLGVFIRLFYRLREKGFFMRCARQRWHG
jgi:hypothetical protein